jgi:hypothetical protein
MSILSVSICILSPLSFPIGRILAKLLDTLSIADSFYIGISRIFLPPLSHALCIPRSRFTLGSHIVRAE